MQNKSETSGYPLASSGRMDHYTAQIARAAQLDIRDGWSISSGVVSRTDTHIRIVAEDNKLLMHEDDYIPALDYLRFLYRRRYDNEDPPRAVMDIGAEHEYMYTTRDADLIFAAAVRHSINATDEQKTRARSILRSIGLR